MKSTNDQFYKQIHKSCTIKSIYNKKLYVKSNIFTPVQKKFTPALLVMLETFRRSVQVMIGCHIGLNLVFELISTLLNTLLSKLLLSSV